MSKNKRKYFALGKDFFEFCLGIIIIIFIIIVTIKLGQFSLNAIKIVIDQYPTIAVALITGLTAFITVPVGKYLENKYTIKNQIRKEREEIYIDFLNWLIKNVLNGEINTNKNIVDELKEHQNKIVIYGSDKVLKSWANFRNVAINISNETQSSSEKDKTKKYIANQAPGLEKLILDIRKELGYKNKHIKQYDILGLYINNINDYIESNRD